MTTNTMKKAVDATNINGLHTDTNGANFRAAGAKDQAPDGNVFTQNIVGKVIKAFSDALRCATIHASQKWPGASNTKPKRQTSPKVMFFHVLKFMVLDVGRAYPQGWPHRFGGVTKPHIHSADLVSQRNGFCNLRRGQTMTTTTPKTGPAHFIYITLMLEAVRSSETLAILHNQPVYRDAAELLALWDGARALKHEARGFAIKARDAGQLLFAFEGTSVLEGGAV